MTTVPELVIDLTRSPSERWMLSEALCEQARQLGEIYGVEFRLTDQLLAPFEAAAKNVIPSEYWEELESIAAQVEAPLVRLLLCNTYYDLIKSLFGCTGFAVDTPNGPLHARNMDWWTENRLLNEATLKCRFLAAPAGEFMTIGWPGFVGAFSAVAPGRFAITLNAVISRESGQTAIPVVFLIRQVLENVLTYDEAVDQLSTTTIPCDCLLLVTGTKPGQMAVIERTPTRFAMRQPTDGKIVVTNDFIELKDVSGVTHNELGETSCRRYERMHEQLLQPPDDLLTCIRYLRDGDVQMPITVQQMAFCASDGEVVCCLP